MRRSKDEILFGILKSCSVDKLTINQLIRVQNLSYKLLSTAIVQLADSGLIIVENDHGRRLVNTTREGLEALGHYKKAAKMLRSPTIV